MAGTVSIAIYSNTAPAEAVERALDVADAVGLTVEDDQITDEKTVEKNGYDEFTARRDGSTLRFSFNLNDDRSPDEPILRLSGLNDTVHPKWAEPDTGYDEWMDIVFELVCRLATQLEADYVAWLNTRRDPMKSVPRDRPIGEAIESPPTFGVYTTTVLDDLGGIGSLFDAEPWYVTDIDSERTLVIESKQPWVEGDWRPPAAGIVTNAEFRSDSERTIALSDPFASLNRGEYGADIGVPPDEIADEFRNDALRLRRVRVDDERNLCRTDTGAFVRNIVDRESDDRIELIQHMLSDVPREPNTDEHVSALLHHAIPPTFVRLADPTDENVVTKVMALDTNVSKIELLVSLGRVVQQEDFTAEDLESMEEVLDTLHKLDDTENIDQYIRNRLL